MATKYLSKEQLRGFEKYKYSSVDTSVLSNYVMHPFWNQCVKFCPLWLAPNMLTFVGFLLTVVNFVIFSWYDYDFRGKSLGGKSDFIPTWVWVLSGLNMFLAYTLDGIDGKQARRTGRSGPLGELFDHGLDSYSSVLIPACLYSVFGRNEISPLRMYFLNWNIFINFYLTHWEKYNTGVLFLPWGYDFTMIGTTLILLVTAWIGPSGWDFELTGNISFGKVFEFTLYTSAMITSQTVILWNIYKSYRDKTGKMRSFTEAIRPLVPLFYFAIISCLWASYSPNNIIDYDPRMFYLLTGTIFSNICCRLIVSQMSNTRCEASNMMFYPFTLATIVCLTMPISKYLEMLILYALSISMTIAHIHYGARVVQQMCHHFKIKCFKISNK